MKRNASRILGASAALLLLGCGLKSHAQTPYGGTPAPIPGIVQVPNFDDGGEGVAYHDTDPGNNGGQYRTGEGVDIEFCGEGNVPDGAGVYNVGYCNPGEWLKYTVSVTATDKYNIGFRVAAPALGGTFHLEVDGTDVTGTLQIPGTGGYQNWTTVTASNVSLTAGQHVLRLSEDAATNGTFGNFHYMNFTVAPKSPPAAPTGLTGIGGNTAVYLNWTVSAGATSYAVKRSATGAANSFTAIGTTANTAYVDSGLTNGTKYYYVVNAVNSNGSSPDSNVANATPTAAASRILYYPFEDGPGANNDNVTVTDTTGNGYNGTFMGGAPTLTQGFSTDAKVGKYAGFTDPTAGVTRYIAVSSALPDLTSQFSVFTWVKMVPGANIQTLFANSPAGNSNGFRLYVNHYGTSDSAIVYENRDGAAGNGDLASPANTFPTDGNYHAVALVADKLNGTATIYLDGAVVASGSTNGTNYQTTGQIFIGQFSDGNFLSTSKFDEFQIYRGAISAATVATLSGVSLPPPAPTNLAGVSGNGSASLTWTGVTGASYNLYRSLSATGTFTAVKTGIATTAYTDTGLTNGTTYYYYVTSANAAGESTSHSNIVSVIPADNTTLVLNYTFEDGPANGNSTITDTTGHGYNGSFQGSGDLSQGFSTDAFIGTYAGSVDQSANRWIQVSSAKPFDFTSQFTMFTWIKMADNFQIQSILGNAPGYPENGFKLFVNSYGSQDHKLFFEYEAVQAVSAPTNITDGNYHALALSVDQTNKIVKVYLDGAIVINAALTTPFPTSTAVTGSPINLGTDGFFFSTSKFDDFRIYQGIKTDAQIAAFSVTGTTVTGKIALEGVNNLAGISPNVPLGTFHIEFRTPGTTTVIKAADVSLAPAGATAFGTFSVSGVTPGTYDVAINGVRQLRVVLPNVAVTGSSFALANVTLPSGDATHDNIVDIGDFGVLVNAYGGDVNIAGSGYDPKADFNYDGVVDIGDFGILVNEYGNSGAM